jgi:hypothetical protein
VEVALVVQDGTLIVVIVVVLLEIETSALVDRFCPVQQR